MERRLTDFLMRKQLKSGDPYCVRCGTRPSVCRCSRPLYSLYNSSLQSAPSSASSTQLSFKW